MQSRLLWELNSSLKKKYILPVYDISLQITGKKQKSSETSKLKPKIFVGGLHQHTTKDTLVNYFSQFGDVVDAVIIYNHESNESRRFGYVTFMNYKTVEFVTNMIHIIDNKQVQCKKAYPKEPESHQMYDRSFRTSKIFVGGLPDDLSLDEFQDAFAVYGKIIDIVIIPQKNKPNLANTHFASNSRGFGFVTFATPQSVDYILDHYLEIKVKGKWVECKKAVPKMFETEETLKKKKISFVSSSNINSVTPELHSQAFKSSDFMAETKIIQLQEKNASLFNTPPRMPKNIFHSSQNNFENSDETEMQENELAPLQTPFQISQDESFSPENNEFYNSLTYQDNKYEGIQSPNQINKDENHASPISLFSPMKEDKNTCTTPIIQDWKCEVGCQSDFDENSFLSTLTPHQLRFDYYNDINNNFSIQEYTDNQYQAFALKKMPKSFKPY